MMFSILFHSLLLTSYLVMAQGGYELHATIHSFDNPGRRCPDIECDDCCERQCFDSLMCDYYFSLCQRPAGTPVSYVNDQNQGNCSTLVTTHQRSDGSNVIFTHSAFNVSNPITFSGESWPDDGVQLFLEIIDHDDNIFTDELIDRFAINVSIPVGRTTERTTYPGIFGYATIIMNFTLVCTENFYGPNCNRMCLDNCTCEPGFTGEFCATSIDDCVGVECGLNQRCVDGHLNFSCGCQPGYTGSSCTIDIDECLSADCNNGRCINELPSFSCICDSGYTGPDCGININECVGVNCNHGYCVDEVASFSCICNNGFTGKFCETQFHSYELQVSIHSFDNPERRCPDMECQDCCEQECNNSMCEYYFSLCQRPAGTPVSYVNDQNQGNCSTLVTSHQRSDGSNVIFTHLAFNVSNPITFSGESWPDDGVQLFLEIIDHDDINDDELIDRFAINVSIPVGSTTERTTYPGIFGFATIDMNFTLVCTENFYGPNCNTCEPGFTGEFCATSIDDCVGVECGLNQRCVDGHLNFSCVCQPGYTGPDCAVDIDECMSANCNNGRCVDELASFSCICDPGYTGQDCAINIDDCLSANCNNGHCIDEVNSFVCSCNNGFTGQFCETQFHSYELQVSIHSFDNPGRRCADRDCQDCCEIQCSNSLMCDYYFSLCQRPAGTPVSYVSDQNQGNCSTLFTPYQVSDGSNVTLISNHFTFSGESWPDDGVQLFLEIIDHDNITNDNDELIDRFAINVSILVGSTTESTTYPGIFRFATIDMSFTLTCTENFYGPNCGLICPENCTCQMTSDFSQGTLICATTSPSASEGSTNQPNVVVIATSTSIGGIVLLLLILFTISVALFLHTRKRDRRKVNNEDEYEMDITVAANSDDTENDGIHSLRHRLESNPNNYTRINPPNPSQIDKEATAKLASLTFATNSMAIDKEYEEIDGENCREYDYAKNGETQYEEYDNPLSPDEAKEFKFTPTEDEDFYDYDSPYWMPSNEERELMTQFKKLRIPNISQKELKETAYLGSGAFGTVHKGVWSHSGGVSDQVVKEEVAMKSMESGTNEEERVNFLQEAAIMGQFDHPNIVRIMGILIKENECKIIMELMLKGNLRSHLPALKSSSTNNTELVSQLLCYSRQIASGMSYLSLKGYIHRDLAARNILVSGNDICKIGDFGLSRDLNKENYYMSHGGMIPVKWTAPEALHYRLYSTASDVWSYGCVLYEIWTLGVKPYSGLTNGEVTKKISTGYRLPPPPGCPRIVYEVMIKSWNTDSSLRPGFYDICSMLNLPEFKVLSWTPEDLSTYSKEARTLGAPLAEAENMFSKLQQTYFIN